MYGQPEKANCFTRFDVEGFGIYLEDKIKIPGDSLRLKLGKIADAETIIPIGVEYYNGVTKNNSASTT